MIYLQLFLSFLQIGAFSFGGGYAAMPLIQSQVVDSHKWLSMAEFTNLITISQMTPGPIAVNSATFVGLKVAGIRGSFLQADRRYLLQNGQLGLRDLPPGQKNDQKQIGGQQP